MFDELFSGTAERDGEDCAQRYMELLLKSKRLLCIYATHFDKLKELEKQKGSNCVNYKIDPATEDHNGDLKYPYTLSKGVNMQGVGVKIAEKAGLFD